MKSKVRDVWEFLEQPNDVAPEAQALYSWGLNCDRDSNPFLLYLDLIGWSDDNYGAKICQTVPALGFTELCYLADALNEFAAVRPRDVREWIDELMQCEGV